MHMDHMGGCKQHMATWMDGWMNGWLDALMHAQMYGLHGWMYAVGKRGSAHIWT